MLNQIRQENGNGGRFAFEKFSQIRKFQDFNVQPDYFIDTFHLTTSLFTAKEIGFAGNHISVLNSFIPANLENFSLYYHIEETARNTFTTTQNIINPRTIPIFGGMNYEVQYNKLYRTITGPNTPVIIANDNFTFVHNLDWSTPILIMLGRDVRPIVNESFLPDCFKFNFTSNIPTSSSTSNNAIDVLHGWLDLVKVSIIVTTAVNPITFEIQQRDRQGQFHTAFNVAPVVFPYNETFILPEKTSGSTRVIVLGGGASETGKVEIDVIICKRG